MPMTCPYILTSAPPELPGLMAASVWMHSILKLEFSERTCLPIADTMPLVTVLVRPAGLPMATTFSPT